VPSQLTQQQRQPGRIRRDVQAWRQVHRFDKKQRRRRIDELLVVRKEQLRKDAMTRRMKRIQSHLHVVGRVGARRRRKRMADDLERRGVGLAVPGEEQHREGQRRQRQTRSGVANRVVS
jgi:hypothetical protein